MDGSLQSIKQALMSEPVLANPNYNKPFIILTNVSDLGIAGVLVTKKRMRK